MNDDMMKHPFELSWDPDSNPQPLVHKTSMLPLTHAGGLTNNRQKDYVNKDMHHSHADQIPYNEALNNLKITL